MISATVTVGMICRPYIVPTHFLMWNTECKDNAATVSFLRWRDGDGAAFDVASSYRKLGWNNCHVQLASVLAVRRAKDTDPETFELRFSRKTAQSAWQVNKEDERALAEMCMKYDSPFEEEVD